MSAPAPPSIPPRPVKQQAVAQGVSKLPDIPPRPSGKRIERSISPANYPGSPLNELPSLIKTKTAELARPPSVDHLPTPGEEGMEYANVQYAPKNPTSALAQDANTQTRTVAEDLHLHAPKPSLPKSTATAQVQGVTRTDSVSAASHGVGKATSQEDLAVTRTRSRQSFSRPDSAASGDRRRSLYEDEHGPAELGLRVPINPLLGDVQAPTPSGLSPQVTGVNSGSPRRPHSRKRSGVDDYRPPDSYGLHGHGTIANTRFEREWYAKHPDQLEHEEGRGGGVYESVGSGRGSFALSSDELNKIVRDTASRGAGLGTRESINSYPDEQIGYYASEEYQRSQQNTPHPESLSRVQTHTSQANVESPLRRTSFPAEDAQPAEIRRSRLSLSRSSDKGAADDSDNAFHIDEPKRTYGKITGGEETMNETEAAKPYVEDPDEAHDYRVPILAEDEVAKSIAGEHLHPAVSPKFERRNSAQYEELVGSGAITPTSRPASRPGSIYQMHSASHSLSRFLSHQELDEHPHTPLEDVAEYEPLFDDADNKKALSHTERFKRRPDSLQKRFPSQDIWEDTPSSAMYMAEVSTPDLPRQADGTETQTQPTKTTSTFETPEAEHARKGEVSEQDKYRDVSREQRLLESKFAPHLRDDMAVKGRPALLAQRFPSQDIWEDTPDSNYLTTTVNTPPATEPAAEDSSPVESKPPIPARPAKTRLAEGVSSGQAEPGVAPQIPARPPKRLHAVPPPDAKLTDPQTLSRETSPTELRKTPSIPDRPKPQIPARPAKKPDGVSVESSEVARQKPQVPARPAGGAIAALKGNFMSDLNKKLGLGPPKEKEPEPEAEAKPLEDARKGRARGPQRRAPAKSPSSAPPKSVPQFAMFSARPLWQINDHDELTTILEDKEETESISVIDHALESEQQTLTAKDVSSNPEKASPPIASSLAANTSADVANSVGEADPEGTLSREITATSVSGEELEREGSKDQTHVLSASRMTTATDESAETQDQLEKVATKELEAKADDEPIKVRNEQVNAPAPESANTHSLTGRHSDSSALGAVDNGAQQQEAKGEDKPQEPMNEDDIDYGKLEAMTAMADGKMTAEEDPQAQFSNRKIID